MQRFFAPNIFESIVSSNGNRKVQAVGVMKRFARTLPQYLSIVCVSLKLGCVVCVCLCCLFPFLPCARNFSPVISSYTCNHINSNNLRFELELAACKPYVNVVHRRIVTLLCSFV